MADDKNQNKNTEYLHKTASNLNQSMNQDVYRIEKSLSLIDCVIRFTSTCGFLTGIFSRQHKAGRVGAGLDAIALSDKCTLERGFLVLHSVMEATLQLVVFTRHLAAWHSAWSLKDKQVNNLLSLQSSIEGSEYASHVCWEEDFLFPRQCWLNLQACTFYLVTLCAH